VWPHSHSTLWCHVQNCLTHTQPYNPHRDPVVTEIKRHTSPVECHGPAGTVVLWHERLVHSAGRNTTAVGAGAVMRMAMIHGQERTVFVSWVTLRDQTLVVYYVCHVLSILSILRMHSLIDCRPDMIIYETRMKVVD
jgi:hypothetical protein